MKQFWIILALALFANLPWTVPRALANDIVTAYLVHPGLDRDGALYTGLEIRLDKGWKTYWRSPGEGGLAPSFDWSQSKNVRAAYVGWPSPTVFAQGDYKVIGYANRVVLPIKLIRNADRDVSIKLRVNLGVCDRVCVPYEMTFTQNIPASPGPISFELQTALDLLPLRGDQSITQLTDCDIVPTDDGASLDAQFEGIPLNTRHIVAEALVDDVWVSDTQFYREGQEASITSQIFKLSEKSLIISRKDLRFTIITDGRAIEFYGCSNSD